MKRDYPENAMLKSKGILYFPPVKSFEEAFKIYNECGGMIISLEEDGFLVEEPVKISRLYEIPPEHLKLYFEDVLNNNLTDSNNIKQIVDKWFEEEGIADIK